MKLPDFFVIGAPKAGTTALFHTIRQHPGIYMSPVKEPHFFTWEGRPPVYPGPLGTYPQRYAVWEPHRYAQLFAAATEGQIAGEASPTYLDSPLAAGRIRKSLPRSRIVVILRQPAERAYSNYQQMRQYALERKSSFTAALAAEEQRRNDGWLSWFFYRKNGFYHPQLSVWCDLFPREQIRVYLYEDWREKPREMIRDLFDFLEVDPGFSPAISRRNVTLLPRSRRLYRWANHPESIEQRASFLPAPARRIMVATLRGIDGRVNRRPPPPLAPEIHAGLTAGYREDILNLQDLIGRDLTHWLKSR